MRGAASVWWLVPLIAIVLGLAACGSDSGSQAKAEKGPCITEARPGEGPACGALAREICGQGPIDPRCVAAGLQKNPTASEDSTPDPSEDTASSPSSSGVSFASPDFVITVKGAGGDRAQVLGHVGRATTLGGSDADQEALANCSGAANGRAMVARLDLRTTVTSSLAAHVELSGFNSDSAYSIYQAQFLMNYSEGPECGDGGLSQVIDLGDVEPNTPHDFTLWIVLANAISPDDPSPSLATLGQHTLMGVPTVLLGGSSFTYGADPDIRVGGPRVIDCSGKTISIVGTVPKRLPSSGTGDLLSCRPTATPKFSG
jgi:hypothetical protein